MLHLDLGIVTDADPCRPYIRPVIPKSEAPKLFPEMIKETYSDMYICEYGEYPQNLAGIAQSRRLEALFTEGRLEKTGKMYSFNADSYDEVKFNICKYPEYVQGGSKYIRVIGKGSFEGGCLSNDSCIKRDKIYWIRVEPISWMVSRKTGIWVAANALFPGLQYKISEFHISENNKTYKPVKIDFDRICNQKYLDLYFSREMLPITESKENLSLAKGESGAYSIAVGNSATGICAVNLSIVENVLSSLKIYQFDINTISVDTDKQNTN